MDEIFRCHTDEGEAVNTPVPTEGRGCADNPGSGLIPLSSLLQEALENSADISCRCFSDVMTNVDGINNFLMGMQPGDLILLVDRPGMGKTRISLDMAVAAAKETGKTVAIFSLQWSRCQLAMELLSGESHINDFRTTEEYPVPDDWDNLLSAADTLSKLDIRIDDDYVIDVTEIRTQCRRVNNLSLIVVNDLYLIQPDRHRAGVRQARNDIGRMMKVTAEELGVPIICLSSCAPSCELRQNKRPMLSDLRECDSRYGSIVQYADAVIGIYRDNYYDIACKNPNSAEAIILKNHRGRTGTVYLRRLPVITTLPIDKRRHSKNGY